MSIIENPLRQKEFDEIIQEIKKTSDQIAEDAERGKSRQWKTKMQFSIIQDLVNQAEALIYQG